MKFVLVRNRSIPAPAIVPGKIVPADAETMLKRWEAVLDLGAKDVKAFDTIKDGDTITDYQNVRFKGYLSTFVGTTASDRQGDYVENGAFTETLKRFKQNPVMLRDHVNNTSFLSGSFIDIREDTKGLFVEGLLSNAPDVQSVRFKVAEGHLRTLSMGGVFHYKEDGRGIFKVDLWEGSLTPIPANPDALFSVRALTEVERKFIKSGASSFYDFLLAERAQNQTGLAA
jgi:HK97 family phage prohead protease